MVVSARLYWQGNETIGLLSFIDICDIENARYSLFNSKLI